MIKSILKISKTGMGWLTQCVCGARGAGSEPDVRKKSAGKKTGKKRKSQKKYNEENVAITNAENNVVLTPKRDKKSNDSRVGRDSGATETEDREKCELVHKNSKFCEESSSARGFANDQNIRLDFDGEAATKRWSVHGTDINRENFVVHGLGSRNQNPEVEERNEFFDVEKTNFVSEGQQLFSRSVEGIDQGKFNDAENTNLGNVDRQLNLSYVVLNDIEGEGDDDSLEDFGRADIGDKSMAKCQNQRFGQNTHRATMPISRLPRSKLKVKKSSDFNDIEINKYGFRENAGNPTTIPVRDFSRNRNSCSFEVPWCDDKQIPKKFSQTKITKPQVVSKSNNRVKKQQKNNNNDNDGLKEHENGKLKLRSMKRNSFACDYSLENISRNKI